MKVRANRDRRKTGLCEDYNSCCAYALDSLQSLITDDQEVAAQVQSIQAVHTLQPRSADIEYCCLEVTPTGLINCIIHASAALSKAFLRKGSSLWNRMQKIEPLATASTWSTWIAMPCEKGTVKSCCQSYATPTFQLTKGTGF